MADSLKFGEYVFANGHSNVLTGISELKKNKDTQLLVYPNPASSTLYININNYKLSDLAS